MLIIGRKVNEKIYIGDDVVITICSIDRGHVRLGIDAPREVAILRKELLDQPWDMDATDPRD